MGSIIRDLPKVPTPLTHFGPAVERLPFPPCEVEYPPRFPWSVMGGSLGFAMAVASLLVRDAFGLAACVFVIAAGWSIRDAVIEEDAA